MIGLAHDCDKSNNRAGAGRSLDVTVHPERPPAISVGAVSAGIRQDSALVSTGHQRGANTGNTGPKSLENRGYVHRTASTNSNLGWLSPNPTADNFPVANFYGPNLLQYQTWTAPAEMAHLQWVLTGFGTPPWSGDCDAFETLPNCIAIILAINTSSPLVAGRFGMTPTGFWTSQSLLAGGQTWEINREANPDIICQEWYAWPVGTAGATPVMIPVIESFEVQENTEETVGSISIGLPQLSAESKKHLAELLARIKGGTNGMPNAGNPAV